MILNINLVLEMKYVDYSPKINVDSWQQSFQTVSQIGLVFHLLIL